VYTLGVAINQTYPRRLCRSPKLPVLWRAAEQAGRIQNTRDARYQQRPIHLWVDTLNTCYLAHPRTHAVLYEHATRFYSTTVCTSHTSHTHTHTHTHTPSRNQDPTNLDARDFTHEIQRQACEHLARNRVKKRRDIRDSQPGRPTRATCACMRARQHMRPMSGACCIVLPIAWGADQGRMWACCASTTNSPGTAAPTVTVTRSKT